MIFYRKKLLRICEIWYDSQIKPEHPVDIVQYKFIPEIIEGSIIKSLHTILIDLAPSEDEIFQGISKSTRYKISRCMDRDGVVVHTPVSTECGTLDELRRFFTFFNDFAASKNRDPLYLKDLEQFLTTKSLVIREAIDEKTGQTLAMHSYAVGNGRARLLQSCSHYRTSNDSSFTNMIGRANRMLHWDDLRYFKAMGVAHYDFGGWHGGTDRAKLLINQFKEEFGGQIIPEYTCMKAASFLGSIPLALRRIKKHS